MEKWVCEICGYVYDPEVGDDEGGIAPGTPFEDLPDDYKCPICNASKEYFKKDSTIVAIHTGGLQGISGLKERFGEKLLNF